MQTNRLGAVILLWGNRSLVLTVQSSVKCCISTYSGIADKSRSWISAAHIFLHPITDYWSKISSDYRWYIWGTSTSEIMDLNLWRNFPPLLMLIVAAVCQEKRWDCSDDFDEVILIFMIMNRKAIFAGQRFTKNFQFIDFITEHHQQQNWQEIIKL